MVNSNSKLGRSRERSTLVIGVVNNMPDGALQTTEQQFCELLKAASLNTPICLRYFSLPGIFRTARAREYVSEYYQSIDEVDPTELDGLIVTGTEPRTPLLEDEPYWPALKALVDEVSECAIPTVWSCLAAHAAVLYLDKIRRRPLEEKLSGVFHCRKLIDHEILNNGPTHWLVPHSRQNELVEEELLSNGYRILSRSAQAGADIFVSERDVLFVFLQGHFEYDRGALFREYRRDVRRFLAGERDYYPAMPRGYFSSQATAALTVFQERALNNRSTDLLLDFPQDLGEFAWGWHDQAVRLYANWLGHIANTRNVPRVTRSIA